MNPHTYGIYEQLYQFIARFDALCDALNYYCTFLTFVTRYLFVPLNDTSNGPNPKSICD